VARRDAVQATRSLSAMSGAPSRGIHGPPVLQTQAVVDVDGSTPTLTSNVEVDGDVRRRPQLIFVHIATMLVIKPMPPL
jgi:hypothetical protein